MDTRQYAPYFQALDIIRQLEAKAAMLEGLGELERVAAIRAKIEAKKAELPPAPPEPENHTAPIVQTVVAKVDAADNLAKAAEAYMERQDDVSVIYMPPDATFVDATPEKPARKRKPASE